MRASIIEQILGGIAEQKDPLMTEKYPQYGDLARNKVSGNQPLVTFYPDGSRQFDDLVLMIGMITKEKSSLLTILASFLLHQNQTNSNTRIYFHDGDLTPPHSNNFIEFNYVLEGQCHKQIEGRDYVFNKRVVQ